MKTTSTLLLLLISIVSFGQTKGENIKTEDPVCKLWQAKANAATIFENGEPQEFFFILGETSEKNMMAPFYMEGMGFACPTYFSVKSDNDFIYFNIGEACSLDMTEAEKKGSVKYKVSKDGKTLTLTIDGEKYEYEKWEG